MTVLELHTQAPAACLSPSNFRLERLHGATPDVHHEGYASQQLPQSQSDQLAQRQKPLKDDFGGRFGDPFLLVLFLSFSQTKHHFNNMKLLELAALVMIT